MTAPSDRERARDIVMKIALRDNTEPKRFEESVGIMEAALDAVREAGFDAGFRDGKAMGFAAKAAAARAEGERSGLEKAAMYFEKRGCMCFLEQGHLGDCPTSTAIAIRALQRGGRAGGSRMKDGEIAMTNQWECPRCTFPENFMPNCSMCGYYNPEAEPESARQREKFGRGVTTKRKKRGGREEK